MMESTIGLYTTELIDVDPKRCWRDAREVETETASWVYWYNHQRLHSSIGDVPPIEYEQDYEEFNIVRKPSKAFNRSLRKTQADSPLLGSIKVYWIRAS